MLMFNITAQFVWGQSQSAFSDFWEVGAAKLFYDFLLQTLLKRIVSLDSHFS